VAEPSRLSLRRRVALLLAGAFTLSAVFVVITAVAMAQLTEARVDLADRLDPAATTSGGLLAALLDQETGLRGYALTGQEQFLAPWQQGSADASARISRLRDHLDGERELLRALERVEVASATWRREFAEPLLANPPTAAQDPPDLARGKETFDSLRRSFDAFDSLLEQRRDEARATLESQADQLRLALTGLAIVLLAILVTIWWALDRWVLSPVGRVAADTRVVALGDLDHRVEATGPREFVELADDVERMRARIVTELRATEHQGAELARSNAELEQFAYVASHDLQEPLRKVASFCQMLQQRYTGQLDERADQYIDFAVDGAKRMQDLINDLLTFSRVGRTTDRFVEVDMDEVLGRTLATLSRVQRESRATIEAEPLPTVVGDPALLTSLLQNLIGNALKFRGEDPPLVEVSVRASDRPAGADPVWEFTVQDNGIGMDPRYAAKVFELFQRLHGRSEYEGTGIGLALCRKIVEFHGGTIWIDTGTERSGTTIRFTLPEGHGAAVPATTAAAPLTTAPVTTAPRASGSPERDRDDERPHRGAGEN